MEKQRLDLKNTFRDGARPTGGDFTNIFDSFVHRSEDGLNFSGNNLRLNNLTLGNFGPSPVAGAIQFTGTELQVYDGTAWKTAGGDNPFKPLNQQPATIQGDLAYFGKIGVNLGVGVVSLTDDLEVGKTGSIAKTRSGTAVIGGNGAGGNRAMFFHSSVRAMAGTMVQNFAFAQDNDGTTVLNSPTGRPILFCVNNITMGAFTDSRLALGGTTYLTPVPVLSNPSDPIPLHVNGHAIKSLGGTAWLTVSDIRTKKDIHVFDDGLEKLKALRIVNFRYNGSGGTTDNQPQVGLIGQEVENLMPYMVQRLGNKPVNSNDTFPEDMLLLDTSPLIFVVINAIRELDEKISALHSLKTPHHD